jgi:hypothetical protein
MTSTVVTVLSRRPAATAKAWFRRVATKTADRTVCAAKWEANAMASSWVLSSVSAKVTNERDARN